MLCHHQNTVLYIHAPRGHILSFFAPSPLLPSTLMLHFFAYAEIIFVYILHMLVFPACAIEVQHHNESSPAVYFGNLDYEQSLFSCVVRRVNRARQSAALASRVSRFPLLDACVGVLTPPCTKS